MARDAKEVAKDNAAVVARLAAASANPALADLTVLSERDGTKTPAIAVLLASCSPVFTQMLTGGFAEGGPAQKRSRRSFEGIHDSGDGEGAGAAADGSASSTRAVRSSFSGEALAAVVEFAATNFAAALTGESVVILRELYEAADYYDIGGLRATVVQKLIACAQVKPEDACLVLEAGWGIWQADDFGSSGVGAVASAALEVVEKSADVALSNCGCLCEGAMDKVLSMKFVGATEDDLFRALQRWHLHPVLSDNGDRKDAVRRLVNRLSLNKMSPSFLANNVAKSGFVSSKDLFDAFKFFSLQLESDNGFSSASRADRSLPKWYLSGSSELRSTLSREWNLPFAPPELLDCHLEGGLWSWDIRAEEMSAYSLSVGMAICDRLSERWCGEGDHRLLMYTDHGVAYRQSRDDVDLESSGGPSYSKGDTVTLFANFEARTLSVSVNGGELYEAFSNVVIPPTCMVAKPVVAFNLYGIESARIRLVKFAEGNPEI